MNYFILIFLIIIIILIGNRFFYQKLNTFFHKLSIPVYYYKIEIPNQLLNIEINRIYKTETSIFKFIKKNKCIFIYNKATWIRNFYLKGSITFNSKNAIIVLSIPIFEVFAELLFIIPIIILSILFFIWPVFSNRIFICIYVILIVAFNLYNFIDQIKIQKKIISEILSFVSNDSNVI